MIGLGAKLSEQGAAGAVPNGGAHMGPGAPPSHGGPGGPGPGEVAAPNGGAPNGGAMAFGVPPGSVVHTSLGVPTVGLTGPEVVGDSTAVRNWLAILGLQVRAAPKQQLTTQLMLPVSNFPPPQDKAVGAYAKRLAADGFDTTPALATVQEEDLREAGVLKGHRRLILEAVGKLQSACGAVCPALCVLCAPHASFFSLLGRQTRARTRCEARRRRRWSRASL